MQLPFVALMILCVCCVIKLMCCCLTLQTSYFQQLIDSSVAMAGEESYGLPAALLNFTRKTTGEDCRRVYADWTQTYERDVDATGYSAIKPITDAFDSALKKCFGEQRKIMKILDAGAGTGLVAENLRGRGYTNIDALDICQEMLDVAKEKNIYNKLICAALGEEPVNEIATGEYDGLISCGTFTIGHVGPEAFNEIVRQVKSGGLISFTLRMDCLDDEKNGYAAAINKLVEDNKWEMISKDLCDYLIKVDRPERFNKCYLFVFKVV